MLFDGARHLHLAYAPPWDTADGLFDAIHRNGCTLSLDAGWHEDWLADPRALGILRQVDVFFPNEIEAARMTGETEPARMLQRFADAGAPCVALKLGAEGSALLHQGAVLHAAAAKGVAGRHDGRGRLLRRRIPARLAARRSTPARCLAAGNICGALSTQAYGGIAGFPSRERLMMELNS